MWLAAVWIAAWLFAILAEGFPAAVGSSSAHRLADWH